jgi:hypothetical protein
MTNTGAKAVSVIALTTNENRPGAFPSGRPPEFRTPAMRHGLRSTMTMRVTPWLLGGCSYATAQADTR